MAKRKKKQSKKQLVIYILVILLFALSYYISNSENTPSWSDISKTAHINQGVVENEGNLYVHYIDVGQADCELIKCGDDIVLIDAGEVDCYKTIKTYLDLQNVTEIDYLVLTHAHADHIGSADDIINNYKIDNIIMSRLTQETTPTTSVYRKLLNAISNSDAKVYAAVPGDEYKLESFNFKILAPNDDYSDLNNTSVVVKATYMNNSFIFQGDAEQQSEKDILLTDLDISADVIKLGHHGSRTSSSIDYLKRVNPQVAIVSCGVDNKYNHPHPETIAKLDSLNIPFYRTDVSGSIVIESDGTNFSVKTER